MKKTILLFDTSLGREEAKAAKEVITSGWLSQGPKVAEFESRFAEYIGTKFAVAVSSATSALHLCLVEAGISTGCEVITSPLTFVATVNAILYQNAKPVFADIDPRTFNINPASVQEKVNEKTKAIIPVHYAGEPCDMRQLKEIAEDHSLLIIEDAAHALGAKYQGKKVGGIGNYGCFSFYATKNITTGEGGMVTLNQQKRAERIKALRCHGMTESAYQRHRGYVWQYDIVGLGFNYRMNEIEAAIGLEQLKKLDEMNGRRIENAGLLNRKLKSNSSIRSQYVPQGVEHVYHFYPAVVVDGRISRNEVLGKLRQKGVLAAVHYTPVYLFPFYREMFGNMEGTCPLAEDVSRHIISLPCHQNLTADDIEYVANTVNEVLI